MNAAANLHSAKLGRTAAGAVLLIVNATFCFGQGEKIDTNRLWEIERLVVNLPNDSFGGLAGLTQQELDAYRAKQLELKEARASRIKSEPGLAPYLIALADRYIAEPGRDGLPMIMESIASRDDIPAAELQRFFDKGKALLEGSATVAQPGFDDFLIGLASMIAAHPSPDNEAILVKMLQLRNIDSGMLIAVAAGKALATCGTLNARAEMEATAEWFSDFEIKQKRISGFGRVFYGYVAQYQQRLNLSRTSPHGGQ